jgi:hypothetical protein
MGTRKFRQKVYFRGPVYFKNLSGVDISFLDDQQLDFGSSNDVSVEWDTDGATDSLTVTPAAAGSQITLGTSTYYLDVDGNVNNVDIDLYGTNPDININRNLQAASTNTPVVYIRQQFATDDQPALQVVSSGEGVAINCDGPIDLDHGTTVTSGATLDVRRNLPNSSTDTAVVYLKQDHASDDMAVLQIVQDGLDVAALDVDGAVDIDNNSTAFAAGALLNITRDLASSNTDTAVAYIKQDNAGDDQACLTLVNDAATQLTLDAQGWCNVGYTTTQNTQSTVGTGSVRLLYKNSKWFWQVHTGSGTYKYLEISSSTTA